MDFEKKKAGKQYNVQLPSDPGPAIKLQITPALN